MSVKFHKRNTNFQTLFFLAGSCHTLDGAYFMLKELKEEREAAINNHKVTQLRRRAKKERALQDPTSLENQADLLEIDHEEKTSMVLYEAATDELEFINKAIATIEPKRTFGNLSDLEAHEASEREEWKKELIFRAENFVLTSGSIPADHFATMRMHPDFNLEIYPTIENIISSINTPEKRLPLLMNSTNIVESTLHLLLLSKKE